MQGESPNPEQFAELPLGPADDEASLEQPAPVEQSGHHLDTGQRFGPLRLDPRRGQGDGGGGHLESGELREGSQLVIVGSLGNA